MPRALVPLSAQAVADHVGGRLIGDGMLLLTGVGALEEAGPGTLAFLGASRYLPAFRASGAGAVLVREPFAAEPEGPPVRIVVADPQAAMAAVLLRMFPAAPVASGIHPTASLGAGVVLGRDVSVGPHAVLGDRVSLGDAVRVGAGTVLEAGVAVGPGTEVGPGVVCHAGTLVGARCVIKAGAVLGGTGFGYISGLGGHRRIPHVGGCVLGDDVDIGSNCCVDRGSIADTVIGPGSKLDNHVHVGHNARVGARCLIMGGSVLAGSADLGDDVIVAGHSAIGGHLRVGHRARIGAKAGVIGPVPDGADVSGFPARPHREFLRAQAALYRLAKITDELEAVVGKTRAHD